MHHSRTPGPGRLRDSNGPALRALLSRWGVVVSGGAVVRDSRSACRKALSRALAGADALVVSGGVSVGDFDHTREALASLGLREVFWRIAIKPGKPLLFGLIRGKPVFGLPGNPVSSLVCCEEFVRPAVERLAGRAAGVPSYHARGVMANEYPKPAHLRQFVFCTVRSEGGKFLLSAIRPQGSAMLGMSSRARGLVRADIGLKRLLPGMEVDFRWLK
ncbi:MAG: molybdopterin-binding protein [Elusimicrobiota bacterium]